MAKQVKNKTERTDELSQQMTRMQADGYKVLPASVFPSSSLDGEADVLSSMRDVMNFAHLGVRQTAGWGYGHDRDNLGRVGGVAPMCPGGFTSTGTERTDGVENIGTPGMGYIPWGANNQLPNWIALAAGMLTYTATGLKFNADVASGLGMQPVYKFYSDAGATDNEEEIPYASAGAMIKQRILKLQKQLLELTKDYTNQPPRATAQGENIGGESAPGIVIDNGRMPAVPLISDDDEEQENGKKKEKVYPQYDEDGSYFKRIADDALYDMVCELKEQIGHLQEDYKTWKRTNKAVKEFMRRTNINVLNRRILTELIMFGTTFPEVQLTQEGAEQKENSQWKPRIVGLGHWSALESRFEKMDENGISRFVYLSKKWLNPSDSTVSDKIAALPALDPMHPAHYLEKQIRKFRLSSKPEDKNLWARPTRWIFPLSNYCPGRPYYDQPSWWSVFNDIYQFASNIIRDRAIRKQNENTFGRIIYVHSEYLEKLTTEINAQKTDAEKEAIKKAEINKIKNFLANKFNNGQTFAACTFTGVDGKDHDAFRVETIPYNTKTAAEADKTEIADASGIIMFTLECHPDLIGATPGGASSSGGTYQREMLQIKEYKLSPTQQTLISLYNLVKEMNHWDEHLDWHIYQKTLTTLDRNHRGWQRE
ncbi:MAG: hypothetical protein MJZ81_10410 [Bacteroidales bacterium]|nr:hypothetical protein [Bacteroidales bacterium]